MFLCDGDALCIEHDKLVRVLEAVRTEMLLELRTLLEQTEMRGMFYANHASNYYPIRARLPRDRAEALGQLDAALAGRAALKPEWMRAY